MTGYKSWRTLPIRQRHARHIRQPYDLLHLDEVDFFQGIGGLMIVGVKCRKPPYSRDVMQGEWELIAALKNVQGRVLIPFVTQAQPHATVGGLHHLAIIRTVDRANQ